MRETDAPLVPEVSSSPIDTPVVTDGGDRGHARGSSDRRADGGQLEPHPDVETTAPLVPDLS